MRPKTKILKFRVNEALDKFVTDISNLARVNKSDMLRAILQYFYIGYLLGEFKTPLPELKKRFLKNLPKKKRYR